MLLSPKHGLRTRGYRSGSRAILGDHQRIVKCHGRLRGLPCPPHLQAIAVLVPPHVQCGGHHSRPAPSPSDGSRQAMPALHSHPLQSGLCSHRHSNAVSRQSQLDKIERLCYTPAHDIHRKPASPPAIAASPYLRPTSSAHIAQHFPSFAPFHALRDPSTFGILRGQKAPSTLPPPPSPLHVFFSRLSRPNEPIFHTCTSSATCPEPVEGSAIRIPRSKPRTEVQPPPSPSLLRPPFFAKRNHFSLQCRARCPVCLYQPRCRFPFATIVPGADPPAAPGS